MFRRSPPPLSACSSSSLWRLKLCLLRKNPPEDVAFDVWWRQPDGGRRYRRRWTFAPNGATDWANCAAGAVTRWTAAAKWSPRTVETFHRPMQRWHRRRSQWMKVPRRCCWIPIRCRTPSERISTVPDCPVATRPRRSPNRKCMLLLFLLCVFFMYAICSYS